MVLMKFGNYEIEIFPGIILILEEEEIGFELLLGGFRSVVIDELWIDLELC